VKLDVATVAELLSYGDLKMLAQHYRHLDNPKEHLKRGLLGLLADPNELSQRASETLPVTQPTASNFRELLRKGFHDLADLFGVSDRVYNAP